MDHPPKPKRQQDHDTVVDPVISRRDSRTEGAPTSTAGVVAPVRVESRQPAIANQTVRKLQPQHWNRYSLIPTIMKEQHDVEGG